AVLALGASPRVRADDQDVRRAVQLRWAVAEHVVGDVHVVNTVVDVAVGRVGGQRDERQRQCRQDAKDAEQRAAAKDALSAGPCRASSGGWAKPGRQSAAAGARVLVVPAAIAAVTASAPGLRSQALSSRTRELTGALRILVAAHCCCSVLLSMS